MSLLFRSGSLEFLLIRGNSLILAVVAFLIAFWTWELKLSFLSKMTPRYLTSLAHGMVTLLICKLGVILYLYFLTGRRAKIIACVFSGFIAILQLFNQSCSWLRYCWSLLMAVIKYIALVVMPVSSAYCIMWIKLHLGKSATYMLYKTGERIAPWGTPAAVLIASL